MDLVSGLATPVAPGWLTDAIPTNFDGTYTVEVVPTSYFYQNMQKTQSGGPNYGMTGGYIDTKDLPQNPETREQHLLINCTWKSSLTKRQLEQVVKRVPVDVTSVGTLSWEAYRCSDRFESEKIVYGIYPRPCFNEVLKEYLVTRSSTEPLEEVKLKIAGIYPHRPLKFNEYLCQARPTTTEEETPLTTYIETNQRVVGSTLQLRLRLSDLKGQLSKLRSIQDALRLAEVLVNTTMT